MLFRRAKALASELEKHRAWLVKWSERIRSQNLEYIENALSEPMPAGPMLISDCAYSLGLVYGTRGIVELYDGSGNAWSNIAGAVACYQASARLYYLPYFYRSLASHQRFRVSKQRNVRLGVALLCYHMANGDVPKEREMWALLQSPLRDTDPEMRQWWRERPFESFFVTLYSSAKRLPQSLTRDELEFDIYASVESAWENDRALAKALLKACDYHLAHTENTRDRDAEFAFSPMDLLPVEILAINRLREQAGLGAVTVKHPLMKKGGALRPGVVPPELGPLLIRIGQRARELEGSPAGA